MGRVYAVVSAKGGVGKTTTAANLAAALAASGSRVAVVDGDLGMANLASALGIEIGEVTLHDVLAGDSEAGSDADDGSESGDVDVAAAIHEGPHGLSVVPGSPALDAFSRADPERLEAVLEELAADHDYVILDTGAGLSNDTVVPLTYVDEILLVSTPTRDALGDTDKTRQVADRLGATVAGAALLRADPSAAESDVVVETLDVGVLGTVPDADEIRQAAEAGEPLTTFGPDSQAAAAFASLAAGLTGEHVAAPATDDPVAVSTTESQAVGSDDASDDGDTDDEAAVDGDSTPSESSDGVASDDEDTSADADPADEESVDTASDEGSTDDTDGEPDEEESDEEVSDEEADEEESDESDDETPAAGEADEDSSAEADAADSEADPEAPIVEAVDESSDSPVGPADPESVATAGGPADADDGGVYTTPLEEVPIEEAETEAESDDSDEDADEAEQTAADADDDTESDEDDEADAADDGDDESGGGGFFSRFFG